MPRKARFYLADTPVHIVQRGHSRESVFFEDSDYQVFLKWLNEAANRYGCAIHAYVLMTNHVHILATPISRTGISRMMQYVGRCYVPYINYKYGTTGSLWEGRYKSNLIQDDLYLLSCMRFIELNPIRSNLVLYPGDYKWSSYRVNAGYNENNFLSPHELYLKLGDSLRERVDAYSVFLQERINEIENHKIWSACQTGTPLGDKLFIDEIERQHNRKIGHSRRGRPSKKELIT